MSSEGNPGPEIASDTLKRTDSINSDNSSSYDTTILPPEDDLLDSDCETLLDSDDDISNDAVDAANVLEFQEFLVKNKFFDDEVINSPRTIPLFPFFTLTDIFFR